jgi:hypothetical protein
VQGERGKVGSGVAIGRHRLGTGMEQLTISAKSKP